jgi:hypothetical protein
MGNERDENTVRRVIKKRIRHDKDGIHVVGDIDAVIAANVGRGGSVGSVSSSQRIVQRSTARSDTRKGKEPMPAPEKEVNDGEE